MKLRPLFFGVLLFSLAACDKEEQPKPEPTVGTVDLAASQRPARRPVAPSIDVARRVTSCFPCSNLRP